MIGAYTIALAFSSLLLLIEWQTRPAVLAKRETMRRVRRHSAWLAERARNNPGRKW